MAFYQSMAYEASAGSGKTFALVIRYIALLYQGAKPETILALTFTNKAANEMQTRISAVLSELDQETRKTERAEIAKMLQIDEATVLAQRETIYRRYLTSSIRISTIDKFFAQILRLFSQHLGLMPDFTIDDTSDEQRFILRFLQKVRQNDAYKDLVLFAARESKKLGDIFTLQKKLYEKDAELEGLTFDDDPHYPSDADVMKRFNALKMWFEEHCPQLSPSGKKALAKVTDTDALKEATWLAKSSLTEYNYFKKCARPEADTLFGTLKDALRKYLEQKERYLLAKYMHLYNLYKETLLEENIRENTLSFNDVTNLLYRLLHEKIDRDFLYFRLDTTIDHLLIDEFQDTNIIQYKILAPIIDEIHAGIGSRDRLKTFFYVGDIKQSIYRFRGGAKELFHYVQKRYGVTLQKLDTNYRSACNIVNFVNDTFRDKIEDYSDQKCKKSEQRGYIKVAMYEDVAAGVADEVFALLERGIDPAEIAVLTHTNADAFAIEDLLHRRDPNLKVTTQTSGKLINQRYVAAVIELLKYLYFRKEICKASFLALIGKSWDTQIDFELANRHRALPVLIKEIIRRFDLPGQDPNLLKLLEVSTQYKDIEAFLFESEKLNIDSPTKMSEGINILTVHKSKGLEFKHVVLSDRMTRKNGRGGTFIFYYDEVDLQQIYIRTKGREHLDPKYRNALEHENRLVTEDTLNALYVAFTRAEESLIIVHNEVKKFSGFAILDLEPGTIGEPPSVATKREIKEQKPQPLRYRPIRLGLQEQKIVPEKEEADDIRAINFGNALHYLLEILDGFSQDDLENAWWAMKNRFETVLEEGEAEAIRQRVERLITYDPFLELVDGKCFKEQPIIYNEEVRQLDLLVEHEDRYVIIDYKSSEQMRSEHKKQVANYKKAVHEITGSRTDAYLCYVRSNTIELIEVF